MKVFAHKLAAKLLGRNLQSTPKEVIADQLAEKRPLPIGRSEFDSWSSRIISGALVTAEPESQKFALADMLLHLGPTVSHESDGYFINSLRKFAINQTAIEMKKIIHEEVKGRLEKEESEKAAANPVQLPPPPSSLSIVSNKTTTE